MSDSPRVKPRLRVLRLTDTKHGEMEVSDAARLRKLEDENRNLKRLVADLALDILMLKKVYAEKW